MHLRQIFLQHVAQTSPAPIGIEIVKGEGCTLWDADGKEYIDLIGGISVCNIGHRHPEVVNAIKEQADKYLHLLVYGEIIQSPQVRYAKRIADLLPENLRSVYFTNSGAEAVEGAMKLAKRVTGRTQMISFKNSYHGSTQGALSIMGDEYWRNAFRPLLPGISRYRYNDFGMIEEINTDIACVIAETVQAEQGVNIPDKEWLQALRARCSETGALLIFDEIQAGFGRTGSLWAFEQFDVVPDILLLGKALGAGMPLGAFVSSFEKMQSLISNPVLGHITTFGGHPVSCAAGLAGLNVLVESDLISTVKAKAELFRKYLQHPSIVALRTAGLLMAAEFQKAKICQEVISECIRHGVLTDWFLFAPHCLRIAPPLTISSSEIENACQIIRTCCDKVQNELN
ncbi:aspartate aminotransferase family protein [Pollutibacter soli]|uniref:aspartate aminotransferase family protein n=1 Tax=Pollutibacter soli TaxID=3034157 RepID=UPI003013C8D8